jgi:hypothetical protein
VVIEVNNGTATRHVAAPALGAVAANGRACRGRSVMKGFKRIAMRADKTDQSFKACI